ncbi:MAG TPA: carbohydrate ABC transporter permease [Trueperaceae bacterium]|nr:carbohydrate ABC transporter permease [Trueperaceae bacterium]
MSTEAGTFRREAGMAEGAGGLATYRARRRRVPIWRIAVYVGLAVGALVMMIPFLYTVSTALKPNAFVFTPEFLPKNPTLQNFSDAWNSNNFQRYFLNSLKVATLSSLLTVAIATTQAYAFARLRFPGKNLVFNVYLITMMIPSMLFIIPQFLQARELGLLNTHLGLIVFYVVGSIPFQTFLLRGFFESIPRAIEEAAYVDGAGRFTTFLRVVLPLAGPAVGTSMIFSFLGNWDEFTWALTIINDTSLRTLPIALRLFQGQHASQWGLVFAASLIALIPVIIVFVIFQRAFVRGVAAGGVKG